jgi:hypothetical protein
LAKEAIAKVVHIFEGKIRKTCFGKELILQKALYITA